MNSDTLRRYFLDAVCELEDGRCIYDVRVLIRPKKAVAWNLQTYLIRKKYSEESWATITGTTH